VLSLRAPFATALSLQVIEGQHTVDVDDAHAAHVAIHRQLVRTASQQVLTLHCELCVARVIRLSIPFWYTVLLCMGKLGSDTQAQYRMSMIALYCSRPVSPVQ